MSANFDCERLMDIDSQGAIELGYQPAALYRLERNNTAAG